VELDGHPVDLPAILRRMEEAYIDAALARTGGNKKAAADLLGLQRTTLVEKLRRRNRDASIA
jgi:sigma-54 specific flagellar transcriptional regulator A